MVKILDEIVKELPTDKISSVEFEAANIVIYTTSKEFLFGGRETIKNLVSKFKKRIELRADNTLLMKIEDAKKEITKILEGVTIGEFMFDTARSVLIIEVDNVGAAVGKEGGNLKEIEKVQKKSTIRVFSGVEIDILKDGTLDIADSTLAKLDVVGASIHSHFKLSREDQTKRIIRALSNPNVDIFFHPTTRIIQRRDPIDFDFEEVLKAAKKYRAALEINSYPDRLDLHDKMIRQTVEAGVKLVINTDAHAPKHLEFIQYGIAQARRGWATKKDILNTMTAEELLQYLTK